MALLGLLAFSDVGTSAAKIVRCPDGDCYSCPADSWTPNNITPCMQATPGYYVPPNVPVNNPPIPAPPGSYVPGYGATSATLASPGYYVAGSAQSAQTPATAGYYVPGRGATAPIKASLGYYVDGPVATAQKAAPPGSYVPTTGATAPLLADRGYYVPTAGQSAPTAAAPGSYVSTRGATAATLAVPGYFAAGPAATGQTIAPAGSYVPTAGAKAPILATPGYYVASPGQTQPTPAAPGSYVRDSGATSATLARKGYYVPGPAATTELAAPRGTFVATEGATAPVPAPPGTFTAIGGLPFVSSCGPVLESYGGASACRQVDNMFAFIPLVAPKTAIDTTAQDFGTLTLLDRASRPLSIRNIAAFDVVGEHLTTLSLLSYSIEGSDAFSLAGFVPGMTLEQGEQALFQLIFRPLTAGPHHGWLTFLTDEQAGFGKAGKTFRIELSGVGEATVLPPGVVPEPAGWALPTGGFGLVGAGLRRRRAASPVQVR
ncbi:hypothetical protein IP88_14015 [alpha proteobacterium AAP81b]|nr:hypothetical protein IP88_14015 [alpha proteobacterium AAP81b]